LSAMECRLPPSGRGLRHPGPILSILSLMVLDVAVLLLCLALVVTVRYLLGGSFAPRLYLSLVWTPVLYLLLAALTKVYMPLQTPPEIIKRQSGAISFFFLVIALFFFMTHEAAAYSRSIFLVSWGLSLIALPVARGCAIRCLPVLFSWRAPCVLIGSGIQARLVASRLEEPRSCLRLAAVSVPPDEASGFALPQYPFDALPDFAAANPHCYAVLLVSPCADWPPPDAMEELSFSFRNVLLQSPQIDQVSTWTRGVRLGGMTLLTSQFKLLDPWRMRFKRAFDIAFCLTAGLAMLPLVGLLYVLIRLDSPGPAFFTQERLGKDGRTFRIVKFRTMRIDAEARLGRLLEKDAACARQWQKKQKLEDDPRITRVGYWLRRTSIDELPQLANVLRGDMSLVGPRPIVRSEVKKYGGHYRTYTYVRPGLTGLWQISGRNSTGYARRVALDVAYVRNWSIYMDLWIVARTVLEVLRLSGC